MSPFLLPLALVLTAAVQDTPKPPGRGVATNVVVHYDDQQGLLFDVYAVNQPAIAVIRAVIDKSEVDRKVVVEPGLAADQAGTFVRVNLRQRAFNEVLEWVAGAAGLTISIHSLEVRLDLLPSPEAPGSYRDLLDQAIYSYQSLLLQHWPLPEAPEVHLEMGKLRFEAGFQQGDDAQLRMALNDFGHIMEYPDNPHIPEALLRSARVARELESYDIAKSRLQTLVKDFAEHPFVGDAYLELARLYGLEGDLNTSRSMIRYALGALGGQVEDPRAHLEAASLLIKAGEYGLSLNLLDDLIEGGLYGDDLEEALYQRFSTLYEMQRDVEAVETCRNYFESFESSPRAPDLYLKLAEIHLRTQTPEYGLLALKHLETAYPLDASSPNFRSLKAQTYEMLGLLEWAVDLYEDLLDSDDNPNELRLLSARHLATIFFDLRQFEKAKTAYRAIQHQGGSVVESLMGIARCWLEQGNASRAAEVAEYALLPDFQEDIDEETLKEIKKLLGEARADSGDITGAIQAQAGVEKPEDSQ